MKMEWANFKGINFHDLAKKYVKNVKNMSLPVLNFVVF